jgi:hypothetical protein
LAREERPVCIEAVDAVVEAVVCVYVVDVDVGVAPSHALPYVSTSEAVVCRSRADAEAEAEAEAEAVVEAEVVEVEVVEVEVEVVEVEVVEVVEACMRLRVRAAALMRKVRGSKCTDIDMPIGDIGEELFALVALCSRREQCSSVRYCRSSSLAGL